MESNTPQFIRRLRSQLSEPLPAESAWGEMAPVARIVRSTWPEKNEHSKRSAVLMLFYEWEEMFHVPMILRNIYDGPHSGQISLPGGRVEDFDKDLVDTALREANEEVGIDRGQVEILGQLSEIYIAPSQFWVQPVVGFVHGRPAFIPDHSEVQEVIEAPLPSFMDRKNVKMTDFKVGNMGTINVPAYDIKGHRVWGATAMMMSELVAVVEKMKG